MTENHLARIDSHAHIVPPDLIDEARKSGASLGVSVEDTERGPALQFDGLVHLRPVGGLARLEARLEWMEQQGFHCRFLGPGWISRATPCLLKTQPPGPGFLTSTSPKW